MKSCIVYFSGTGNTKYICDSIKQEFKNNNIDCDLIKAEDIIFNSEKKDLSSYDLIGFCAPVHAFIISKFILRAVKKVEGLENKKTFAFRVCAGGQGSIKSLSKMLKRKGANIITERYFIMPSNYAMGLDDELSKELVLSSKEKTKKFVDEIIGERIHIENDSFKKSLISSFIGSFAFSGAKVFGRFFKTNENCDLCEVCVKTCSNRNITIKNNKIKFGKKCLNCMRCFYICPKEAITGGKVDFIRLKPSYNLNKLLQNEDIKGKFFNESNKNEKEDFYKYINEYLV